MASQSDDSLYLCFSGFLGEGHIHVKSSAASGNSKVWQWQVYILGDPQAPNLKDAQYQGHFGDPKSAFRRAITWMSECLIR